jgi:hypothetical protein
LPLENEASPHKPQEVKLISTSHFILTTAPMQFSVFIISGILVAVTVFAAWPKANEIKSPDW